MHFKSKLLTILLIVFFIKQNDFCTKKKFAKYPTLTAACGDDCTGTPSCFGRECGNVDDMCYCDCQDNYKCKITDKGYKWNNGIKLANGSYALNGTQGDGKHYICDIYAFSNDTCYKKYNENSGHSYDCGMNCTGTPSCGKHDCGDVPDMCYCDCNDDKCKTTDKGNKWNKGIKLANGSYALNGTKGDGKEYVCSKD